MTQVTLPEEGIEALFGAHDENLRRMERAFGVDLAARGQELNISS
jgi:phosphate starvation-inducible protein PhoH